MRWLHARRWLFSLAAIGMLAMGLAGCADRIVGQIELLTFDKKGQLQRYARADTPSPTRPRMIPMENDSVRSNDDVVTIVVESAYIQDLPFRLTKSNDVIIFADVWENAAEGFTLAHPVHDDGPAEGRGSAAVLRHRRHQLVRLGGGPPIRHDQFAGRQAVAGHPEGAAGHQVLRLRRDVLQDKPEGLVAIVPAGATPAGPQPAGPPVGPQPAGPPLGPPPAGPSGSFQPAPGIDTVHWLRYGRYALVETKPYNRRTTLIDLQTLKPSDISSDDAWLRIPSNAPLDSSYIVFRVLPGQLAESNDVLRAASDANVKLLDSLRRSDAEINAALEEIKTSATNLQDQVLRSRAESIAYKVFRDAQANKETDCKKIGDRFDNKWSDETESITDETRKAAAKKIDDGRAELSPVVELSVRPRIR